jgi:hypothetical protein
MPYAIEGKISKSPIEGGVPISDEQYAEAKQATKQAGVLIKVHNGKMIITSKPERQDGHKDPVWKNGEWYHEPIPEVEEAVGVGVTEGGEDV